MAKYKIGDRVRIVRERPASPAFANEMVQYLGKTMTVSKVEERLLGTAYRFVEAQYPAYILPIMKIIGSNTTRWAFSEEWISGPAEPQAERHGDNDLRVVIRFHGNETTAGLLRGKTIVKTATARRNPADKYSHVKGAAVALDRLFEKKKAEAEKLEAAKAHCRRATAYKSALPKNIGDKFVVKADCYRKISPGTIVTLISSPSDCGVNRYAWERDGKRDTQLISDEDLEPYWG